MPAPTAWDVPPSKRLGRFVSREIRDWLTWLGESSDALLRSPRRLLRRLRRGWRRGFRRLLLLPSGLKKADMPSLRDLLARGGWTMFLLAAARLTTAVYPFRLFAADWYLQLGNELINISPVMLMGLGMLASVGILNLRASGDLLPGRQLARTLLGAVLAVYVLLIPVQVVATVIVDRTAQQEIQKQWTSTQENLAKARQRQLKPEQLQQLQQTEASLLLRRNRTSRQLRLQLFRDMVRVVLSAGFVVWALRIPLVVLDDDGSAE